MGTVLAELRAALRHQAAPQDPPVAMTPHAPAPGAVAGPSRRLSVGKWVAPGTASGEWLPPYGVGWRPGARPGEWLQPEGIGWSPLPRSGHPNEADAIVLLCEMQHGFATSTIPIALLRRRLAIPHPNDPEIQYLRPEPVFEILSPHGRDYATSRSVNGLLELLARRLGNCSVAS
jgi:hypothetical protein